VRPTVLEHGVSTATVILGGVLPLAGVVLGSGATLAVQQSTTREARRQLFDKARQAQRSEIKTAITAYLEAAQHLQTQLYAREHGREVPDIPVMAEDVWLAHAQVDIVCSEQLREPLVQYAYALNQVARHEERYSDWWAYVIPYKAAFMNAVRTELRWPDSGQGEHQKSFRGTAKET
jgi:hypothetical protein